MARKKLANSISNQIVTLSGQFKKPHEIVSLLKEENPSLRKLRGLKKTVIDIIEGKKEQINSLRETFSKSLLDVPIAHKKVRLVRYEEQYENSDNVDDATKVLRGAKEEMEGTRVNLNLYQMNFYQGVSDEELDRKITEVVEEIRSLKSGEGQEASGGCDNLLSSSSEAEIIPQ